MYLDKQDIIRCPSKNKLKVTFSVNEISGNLAWFGISAKTNEAFVNKSTAMRPWLGISIKKKLGE